MKTAGQQLCDSNSAVVGQQHSCTGNRAGCAGMECEQEEAVAGVLEAEVGCVRFIF